jgi:hypothetical protein
MRRSHIMAANPEALAASLTEVRAAAELTAALELGSLAFHTWANTELLAFWRWFVCLSDRRRRGARGLCPYGCPKWSAPSIRRVYGPAGGGR